MEKITDKTIQDDMACDPVVAYATNGQPFASKEPEIDYSFQGKDFGYAKSLEELEIALDEADAERNNPAEWLTPVEFHTRLENKYSWLR